MALGSDSWVLASSAFSAGISLLTLAYVARRVGGNEVALWAAALFCLLPTFSWAAGTLRMYSLMPAIGIGCWFANREMLRTGEGRWAAVLIILQAMQAYVHAIGFFFAALFALAALIDQCRSVTRRHFLWWLGVQIVSVVIMAPVVGSALVRGTEPLGGFDIGSMSLMPAQILALWGATPSMLAIGGGTFLFLAAFGMLDRQGRILILSIPVIAMAVCVVTAALGKPMFKPPVFNADLAPFLVLAAAMGIVRCRDSWGRWIGVAGAAAMASGLWYGAVERDIAENYKPAATHLAAQVKPGDMVVIPTPSVYWGILRYAVGPDWGEPLSIMPLQDNESWSRLKQKLGPGLSHALGLNPAADFIESQGVRYVIGADARAAGNNHGRLWLVHRRAYQDRHQEDIALPDLFRQESIQWFGDELSVSLLVPERP